MGTMIAFHGSDHKCGTTQLSRCAAEYLAKKYPSKNFLLVNASPGQGACYYKGVSESMENMRPYLSERLISSEDILRRCHYKDNIYVLGGSENPEGLSAVNPDMAQYLFEFSKDAFDFVIADSGAEASFGAALGALFSADKIYMLLYQKETSLLRFEWMRNLYTKLNISFEKYIINSFDKGSPYSKGYICERLGEKGEKIICISRNTAAVDAELEGLSLLSYKDRHFAADIKKLTEDMECQASV